MNKIGFEKEFFLRTEKKNGLVLNPSKYGFDTDDLGILVEIRGEPFGTIEEALASLIAKELQAKALAKKTKHVLCDEPSVKLNGKQIVEMITRYTKQVRDKFSEPKEYDTTKVSDKKRLTQKLSVLHAGMHIHFSKEETKEIPTSKTTINVTVKPIGIARIVDDKMDALENAEVSHEVKTSTETIEYVVNKFIDVPKVLMVLDKEFKDEIAKAKRLPSAYEVKKHGFEYRSLPNNVAIDKLLYVLDNKVMKVL